MWGGPPCREGQVMDQRRCYAFDKKKWRARICVTITHRQWWLLSHKEHGAEGGVKNCVNTYTRRRYKSRWDKNKYSKIKADHTEAINTQINKTKQIPVYVLTVYSGSLGVVVHPHNCKCIISLASGLPALLIVNNVSPRSPWGYLPHGPDMRNPGALRLPRWWGRHWGEPLQAVEKRRHHTGHEDKSRSVRFQPSEADCAGEADRPLLYRSLWQNP